MSPVEGSTPIGELADRLKAMTAGIPSTARFVTAASVDRWLPDYYLPYVLNLVAVRFSWRIRFVKDESETLVIWQINPSQWVMLDATAAISVLGTWDLAPVGELSSDLILRSAKFPPFVLVHPSDAFAELYKPQGASTSATIFFNLDGNILSVTNADHDDKALLRYSPKGVPGNTSKHKYPVAAFLDLIWMFRDWMASGQPLAPAIALPGPATNDTAAHQALTQFLQAYLACSNVLMAEAHSANPRPLSQRFCLADYNVMLAIALKKDGTPAEREENDYCHLQVALSAQPVTPPEVSVALGAPDFVVSGALYDEFFRVFDTNPNAIVLLAEALRLSASEVSDQLRQFVRAAQSRSAIFRVERGDGYVRFAMILAPPDVSEILFVVADFDGNFGDNPSFEVQNIGSDTQFLDDPSVTIGHDIAQYFLPLVAVTQFWTTTLLAW